MLHSTATKPCDIALPYSIATEHLNAMLPQSTSRLNGSLYFRRFGSQPARLDFRDDDDEDDDDADADDDDDADEDVLP